MGHPSEETRSDDLAGLVLQRLRDEIRDPIEEREVLREEDIWADHGPALIRAKRFEGSPSFYPVYRCGDLYSYSLLSLILRKGTLRLDTGFARQVERPGFHYASGNRTIDREIHRLGGPDRPTFSITSPAEFARRMAEALVQDTAEIESRHPGTTNVVMCGGRDSLNLLLLPWKNPVLVASAPPNFELVRAFVANNHLPYEVVALDDSSCEVLPVETLINCCRNDLVHCRWGDHLVQLAGPPNEERIFWKGQAANIFQTPYWRTYYHSTHDQMTEGISPLRDWMGYAERRLDALLGDWGCRVGLRQRGLSRALWFQSAMSLGSHMSLLRQLTGALFLSAYHGPATRAVVAEVDLYRAVRDDVRPMVGEILHGKPVVYPEINPGPPPSEQRAGSSHLQPFLEALVNAGVALEPEIRDRVS